MSFIDIMRAYSLRPKKQPPSELSDQAVMHAVNLGAMVHNMLGSYEQALLSGEFDRFQRKLYELSVEFTSIEASDARDEMRAEWVRRCAK